MISLLFEMRIFVFIEYIDVSLSINEEKEEIKN